ncbi:MAG: glycine--tRNA ligase subunit beta [Elusimicrobiales bacterium]|nr:glycine--tRNA ligase subunit beta [Elusimicrobiales bacterium]
MKIEKKNVIFELTVENIPARFIIPAKEQLKNYITEMLREKHLTFGNINVYATYRRLIVFITNVPSKTDKIVEKVYGPKASLLKDTNGNFTQAAIGFAKSLGLNPNELIVEKHEKKGEVICALKVIPSISSLKILSEIFYESVRKLEFPKNMVWEDSKFKFARPIRNILALWGDKIIPIEICGVKSSKTTYSSYFTGFKKIVVKNADSYFQTMDKNYVVADDENRKKVILSILDGISKKTGCYIRPDENVLNENLYLCEYPRSVVVKYPSEFLKLPSPLLELVMKKQLKFFPAEKEGVFVPFFVGIRDGISKGQHNVEKGYLNVFKARCADALFFYETDLKTEPNVWKEKLKKIIFQGNLGSLYDKTERIKKLSSKILEYLNLDTSRAKYTEYIYYDLASNVVGEFSELENLMNYYYAENYSIKDEEIKHAISEINLPYSLTSNLPSNIYSAVNALAHKIDTLVGDFLIDMIPTGSNDPHGLRRCAIGVFRIIAEMRLNLPLLQLFYFTKNLYPDNIKNKKSDDKLVKELLLFIYQRAHFYFEEKNISADVINSVENVFINEGDVLKLCYRINTLNFYKSKDEFRKFALVYKRLKNIIGGFSSAEINSSIFEYDEEKKIYNIATELEKEIYSLIEISDFTKAIEKLLILSQPLEDFFTNVMVMVDDEKIKNNRLALLKKVYNLFNGIADISKIVSG